MKLPESAKITNDALMLWIMHRFAEVFREHAVLKGGMQLMLMSSERATNDLDYTFVPYGSKTEVVPQIDAILKEIPEAVVEKTLNSKAGRYGIEVGSAKIQVEFNASRELASAVLTTELLAQKVGALPRIIRVMSSDVAFAHKLAAWNERRLIRDLYDAYYWYAIVGVLPDPATLEARLKKVESRLPVMKRRKSMSLHEFLVEVDGALDEMDEQRFLDELLPLFKRTTLEGLFPVFRTKLRELAAVLRRHPER